MLYIILNYFSFSEETSFNFSSVSIFKSASFVLSSKSLTECLRGLFKDSKFCPGCGNIVEDNQNSNEIIDEPQKQNNVCKNCGEELDDDAKFCPNCGEDTTTKNELEVL